MAKPVLSILDISTYKELEKSTMEARKEMKIEEKEKLTEQSKACHPLEEMEIVVKVTAVLVTFVLMTAALLAVA